MVANDLGTGVEASPRSHKGVQQPTADVSRNVHLPPLRFWLASVLLACEIRFLEKAARISSGGASGIALALFHWTHLPVGFWSFAVKSGILLIVWRAQGRRQLLWTGVSAIFGSLLIYLAELVPFHGLPLPLAFPMILLFAYMPSSLLLSCGYSSGGFSSIVAILESKGVSTWVTYSAMNTLALFLMFAAYGQLSGVLSIAATLFAGASNWIWLTLFRRYLPHIPSRTRAGTPA